MNWPSMKLGLKIAAVLASLDVGMLGACASCQQTPSTPGTDASAPPPAPPVAAGDSPAPDLFATPACKAACANMTAKGCKLGAANDCADTFTRIDLNPGVTTVNGKAPTCACIADAGSLTAILGCGIVCPP